jgi:hypothetical protein
MTITGGNQSCLVESSYLTPLIPSHAANNLRYNMALPAAYVVYETFGLEKVK